MRYERFLELGRGRWEEFSERLRQLEHSPRQVSHQELETLAVDYRQVLHDHALASTRFPGTWAATLLSTLAVSANHLLQWQPQEKRFGIFRFYRQTFPRLCRELSRELLICGSLLVLSTILGLSLATLDPGFGTAFIGTEAVEGLARGEIWTDSVDDASPLFSSLIATNNMRVALNAWLGGLAAGLWSLVIVFFNGVMLGSVVAVTFHYGMSPALFEFIAAHGPLELSLIVVAAAAGLHVGWALVAFGDRPRSERLRIAAMRSLQVLLGCLPFFVILGIVESFLSPSPAVGAPFKLAAGLALEAIFIAVVLGGTSLLEARGAPNAAHRGLRPGL